MQTRLLKINPEQPDLTLVEEAAWVLRTGGTVAFPTETVYGLGANGLDAAAVAKVFQAKGRPLDNPLILHIATLQELRPLVEVIAPRTERLIRFFWPGPLTLVLPRSKQVPDVVTGGLDTVAVRMPDHIVAQLLIAKAGIPVAAPSANISGKPSPTTALAVWEDLKGKIDIVVDGGASDVGVESTVLDLSSTLPTLLRPGGVTLEELRAVLGDVDADPTLTEMASRPKSPGMKYTHYAPRAQVIVVEGREELMGQVMQELAFREQAAGRRVGLLVTRETAQLVKGDVLKIMGGRKDLCTVAAGLFAALRAFDHTAVDIIIAEGVSEQGIGLAIMNRLRKAAGYNIVKVGEEP